MTLLYTIRSLALLVNGNHKDEAAYNSRADPCGRPAALAKQAQPAQLYEPLSTLCSRIDSYDRPGIGTARKQKQGNHADCPVFNHAL